MSHKMLMLCLYLFTLSFTTIAQEESLQTHFINNITFQTPVEFSSPESFGLEAFYLLHPANSEIGAETFEIRLIFITNEMLGNMGMNDSELLGYVKAVFLGTANEAKKTKERYFFDKSVTGEVLSKETPKPLKLEVYLLTLEDESKLAIAFIYEKGRNRKNTKGIISTVASTIKIIGSF